MVVVLFHKCLEVYKYCNYISGISVNLPEMKDKFLIGQLEKGNKIIDKNCYLLLEYFLECDFPPPTYSCC